MRLRSSRYFRRVGASIMLAALAAFLLQTAMIIVSEAAASTGSMPQPAVVLSGPVHFHDHLAGNVHSHGGNVAAGHVHHHALHDDHHVHHHAVHDDDDHDVDQPTNVLLGSFACTCAVLPAPIACAIVVAVVTDGEVAPEHLVGVEPDGLSRPPSTPSIA
jgi:hypothetical protein